MSYQALVVEDDPITADLLRFHLEREGFACEVEADGDRALARCRELRPDLVVLDVMLPSRSGVSICQEIRSWALPQPAVLMVSALGDEVDVVAGLAAGADDYVRKPFGISELIARCRRLLQGPRRPGRTADLIPPSDNVPTLPSRRGHTLSRPAETLVAADESSLRIDLRRRSVHVGDERVHLTPSEFHLLYVLIDNADRTVSRRDLLDHLWGYDTPCYARTIDAHICRLRRKLEDAGGPSYVLETVLGRGYRYRSSQVDAAS